jgi:hypothetical protein
LGGGGQSIDEFVDSSRELANRNEIPDQLRDYLQSPYAPIVTRKSNRELQEKVEIDNHRFSTATSHVETLLQSITQKAPGRSASHVYTVLGLEGAEFDILISSARSCGEPLLWIIARSEEGFIRQVDFTKEFILSRQTELYESAFYRTFCMRVKDGFSLHQDGEMLIGGPDVTCGGDLSGMFDRFRRVDQAENQYATVDDYIPTYTDDVLADYLNSHFRWTGTFSSKRRKDHLQMIFEFDEDRSRRHRVFIHIRGESCYFEAMIADKKVVQSFSRDKLLRLTWYRNRNIDLVEFIVRPDGCLVGRAFHPASSMGFEEFIFTAYILSVEADRMEYIIKEPDEY